MVFSLLAGLAIAFALQLLLTNLGIALGLSAVGFVTANFDRFRGKEELTAEDTGETNEFGPEEISAEETEADMTGVAGDESFSAPVTHLLGFGVTLSVAPVLFVASFLSTEFSEIASVGKGVIFGTILWSVYLLIVTWLSSKTVSGIAEAVLGSATAGFRKLFGAVKKTSLPGGQKNKSSKTASDVLSEKERLQVISRELAEVMSTQPQLSELIAQRREDLIKEMGDRAQLSPQQADSVINNLPTKKTPANSSSHLNNSVTSTPSLSTSSSEKTVPYWRKLLQRGLTQLDVTDWDLDTAWSAFQAFKGMQDTLPFNIISLDVEDYLSDIPQWVLQSDYLETDFIERLYDPDADPELVKRQLTALKSDDFVQWLMQRGDLSDDAVDLAVDRLSGVYQTVLSAVEAAIEEKAQSGKDALIEASQPAVSAIAAARDDMSVTKVVEKVEDIAHGDEPERVRASRQALEKISLEKAEDAAEEIVDKQLDKQPDKQLDEQLRSQLTSVHNKLLSYFRYTSLDKLNDKSIADKLKLQLEASELLLETGVAKISDKEDAVKDWLKTSITELNEVISKRKGMSKQQYGTLKSALTAAWDTYYPLSSKKPEEGKSEEDKSAKNKSQEPRSKNDSADDTFYQTLSAHFRSVDWPEVSIEELRPAVAQQLRQGLSTVTTLPSSLNEDRLIHSLHLPKETASEVVQWLKQHKHEWLGLPRRWAKRAYATAHTSEKSLLSSTEAQVSEVGALSKEMAKEMAQQAASQLVHAGEKGQDIVENASDVAKDVLGGALETADAAVTGALAETTEAVTDTLETAQEKFGEAIALAQQKVDAQIETAKQTLQQQAEAVRHQAAIAAWWLFVSLLTSEFAAAGASWLAVRYPLG